MSFRANKLTGSFPLQGQDDDEGRVKMTMLPQKVNETAKYCYRFYQ